MRHVVVMTLTGSLGLSVLFLVDFLALWWISQLRDESLVAAVGFGATLQFFLISISVGMMIAGVALVSRALGRGDPQEAGRIATTSLLYGVAAQTVIAVLVYLFSRPLLILSGAQGEVLDVAVQFLRIGAPSLPFLALGMGASAILRAAGEAWRAMFVTMSAGIVAAFLDPLVIVWIGWGVPGAALVIVISRATMAALGLYWVALSLGILARPSRVDLRFFLLPFLAIAAPAVVTQLSTPFGNWILMRAMAPFGESAVAGLGVVLRLMILCFGGIFALSGAIGGIIGQNYGAGLPERVQSTYLDALKFCAVYTGITWVILILTADFIAATFGLGPEGVQVVQWFCYYGAGAFVFTGALFVSNAAFNNLGRPVWATIANWSRDGVLMVPLAFGLAAIFAEGGVIAAQVLANIVIGVAAAWVGWRYVRHMAGARRMSELDPERAAT